MMVLVILFFSIGLLALENFLGKEASQTRFQLTTIQYSDFVE
jgi:hypothetical protein